MYEVSTQPLLSNRIFRYLERAELGCVGEGTEADGAGLLMSPLDARLLKLMHFLNDVLCLPTPTNLFRFSKESLKNGFMARTNIFTVMPLT